ncbi:hypothetical protein M9H77_02327 [Catharanthus roseus]|uniref:Uncharacterized protein n=1 Tax=Catharanthus roseus TaxID=4058 RepID=A0ACC0C890_CATRO|nr:hypothetical protein M9H77_02327 [Catharanthus roseus]
MDAPDSCFDRITNRQRNKIQTLDCVFITLIDVNWEPLAIIVGLDALGRGLALGIVKFEVFSRALDELPTLVVESGSASFIRRTTFDFVYRSTDDSHSVQNILNSLGMRLTSKITRNILKNSKSPAKLMRTVGLAAQCVVLQAHVAFSVCDIHSDAAHVACNFNESGIKKTLASRAQKPSSIPSLVLPLQFTTNIRQTEYGEKTRENGGGMAALIWQRVYFVLVNTDCYHSS